MRFTHLMLAVWCVAVLCICLSDMGRATAQLDGQEKPAIKTAYAQDVYGGTCSSDLTSITFNSGYVSCQTNNGQIAPGSLIGSSSLCFKSIGLITVSDGLTVTAICADVHCDATARSYNVIVNGSSTEVLCPAQGSLNLPVNSPTFTDGLIACPAYGDVCGSGPTPAPTPAPTSTFPVSGAMSYTRYSTLTMLGLLCVIMCVLA